MTTYKTKIYALLDERDVIRYVGKTSASLLHRMNAHLFETRNGKLSHKCNWIRSMLSAGMLPKIEMLNEVDGDGNEEEARWIFYFKSIGLKLVNGTTGGDGAAGRILSVKSRQKIASANIGKKASEATKLKMSITRLGKPRSPETCLKMSIANKGKTPSEECRRKCLIANTGRKHTEQWKAEMSKIMTGRRAPWLLGKHHTEDTREKMRKTHLERWTKIKSERAA